MAGKHTFNDSMRHAARKMAAEARLELYKTDPVLWAEEVLGVILWSKQKEILRSLAKNKRTAVKSCHSIGKDLPLDTPIPIPSGWTTMGELREGDYVLGEDGKPTRVVYVSEDMQTTNYELSFSDGTTIVAGADHQWNTIDMKTRKGLQGDWRNHWDVSQTRTTQEIVATLLTTSGQNNHLIPLAAPLSLPEADLPIDPYILGAWLGDGTSVRPEMTIGSDGAHIIEKFSALGYPLVASAVDPIRFSFAASKGYGVVMRELVSLRVRGNKHIPMTYLRASIDQRMALLTGILDTDGFVVNTGSAGVDFASAIMAENTAELVRSLGIAVNVKRAPMTMSGVLVGTRYRLAFTPHFNPFSPGGHKHANFILAETKRVTARTIVSARIVPTVTSRCIQVDNARSLYLATENLIPTHNTFICAVAACWWASTHEDSMIQSTAPTYQQVHAQLWEEIRKAHLRSNLRGRVTLGDKWQVERTHDGRAKEYLIGEGKKPADSNIHGFHGTHRPDGVFAILDEACGVHVSIFTGAEAITTSRMDRILATGNPDDPNTEFGRIWLENVAGWNTITVSAYDTPNFTGEAQELLDRAAKLDADRDLVERVNERDGSEGVLNPHTRKVQNLLKGMPDPEWIEGRRADWGEESPRYLSKVLAQFPLTSIDSLFSGSDIETGRNNVLETPAHAFRVLGVDVARYGADKTVVALNEGGNVRIVGVYNTMDTMEVSANVHKLALDLNVDQVRVDGVGVGGGVVDRLTTLARSIDNRYVVVEMTAQASPPDRTLHRNARAYWYDSLKYLLRNALVSLPTDREVDGKEVTEYARDLLREMSSVKYAYPNGIMQIESKEDIRRRGDKSPDFVDAVVMATAPINNIVEDPLSVYRPGQIVELDILADMEMIVSPY